MVDLSELSLQVVKVVFGEVVVGYADDVSP